MLSDAAVECEITECQPLADGRFYLELKGLRRFRASQQTELDGYRVAVPEVPLLPPPLHSPASPSPPPHPPPPSKSAALRPIAL